MPPDTIGLPVKPPDGRTDQRSARSLRSRHAPCHRPFHVHHTVRKRGRRSRVELCRPFQDARRCIQCMQIPVGGGRDHRTGRDRRRVDAPAGCETPHAARHLTPSGHGSCRRWSPCNTRVPRKGRSRSASAGRGPKQGLPWRRSGRTGCHRTTREHSAAARHRWS